MKMIQIYALVDPRNHEIRYVGKTKKTKDARLGGHIRDAKNGSMAPVHFWVRKLLRLGLRPESVGIMAVGEPYWPEAERYWIKHMRERGCKLFNANEGGIGSSNMAPEVRDRIRIALLGRKHSEETKEKRRASLKGRIFTDEHRAKISRATKGRKLSAEHKLKIGMTSKGRRPTPEQLLNMSLAQKASWDSNPLRRLKASERGKAYRASEEAKKKTRGEGNGNSKYTIAMVREVRRLWSEGVRNMSKIGRIVGMNMYTVRGIIQGRLWANVS